MIREWGKLAVSRTRPMRSDKWYEKYAAGMQGKFDIFSHFICNSLYNHTGKQSMRFSPPPGPCGAINSIKVCDTLTRHSSHTGHNGTINCKKSMHLV